MITLYYDDTCTLCTTNAIEMKAKNPSEIKIIPVDDAIEELAEAHISRIEAMTYVCIKNDSQADGDSIYDGESMYKGMDAIRLLCDVADIKKLGVKVSTVLNLPVIKQFCGFSYPIIARNRYYFPRWAIRLIYGKVVEIESRDCEDDVCMIPPDKRG